MGQGRPGHASRTGPPDSTSGILSLTIESGKAATVRRRHPSRPGASLAAPMGRSA